LSEDFKASGEVLLSESIVHGNLKCNGGKFQHDGVQHYTLTAENVDVRGSVFLNDGFKAVGGVLLSGATICGNLKCSSGVFEHYEEGKFALTAENMGVKGSIFLNDGFKAVGGVLLNGATIGGNLKCNRALLENQKVVLLPDPARNAYVKGASNSGLKKYALSALNIEVKGSMFLNEGFEADGEVLLNGATVGGSLQCNRGKFGSFRTRTYALQAENMKVQGSIYLTQDFTALGEVSIRGAVVDGDLVCNGGKFKHSETKDCALRADSMEVKGFVSLSKGFCATGEVNLLGTNIGKNLQCDDGKFRHSEIGIEKIALNMTSMQIAGYVLLNDNFKAVGMVLLRGTNIGRDLDCQNGGFEHINEDQWALFAMNVAVKGNVFLTEDFRANGGVFLYGANIGGTFSCSGIIDHQATKTYALLAESMQVNKSIQLEGCKVVGGLSFANTKVEDELRLRGKIFSDKSINSKLDLEFARVRTLADSEESWPEKGQLLLEGFVYEKLDFASPNDQRSRLRWLNLQNQDSNKGGRFSPQPYEQLARVLKDSGHESDAMGVLIGKQENMRRYGRLGRWGSCWNWFLGKTIAHGYKSTRALWVSLAIILFGFLPFHYGYESGMIEPSDLEAYTIASSDTEAAGAVEPSPETAPPANNALTYPEFFAPTYSLDVFLPVIDLHQANYWLPRASRGQTLRESTWLA
jgi:hypothetical protein